MQDVAAAGGLKSMEAVHCIYQRAEAKVCPPPWSSASETEFLTDPPVLSAILLHLDLPHRPPSLSPARGPPQRDFLLDQTPSFDPADPEPVPDFLFDQSLSDDFHD